MLYLLIEEKLRFLAIPVKSEITLHIKINPNGAVSSKVNPSVQNRLEISETLRFDLIPFPVKPAAFHNGKTKRQVLQELEHFKPTYQTMEKTADSLLGLRSTEQETPKKKKLVTSKNAQTQSSLYQRE